MAVDYFNKSLGKAVAFVLLAGLSLFGHFRRARSKADRGPRLELRRLGRVRTRETIAQ